MKHAVKKKRFFLRRNLALILAMMIMLSTVLVSGLSLTVFAAVSGNIYLDISNNSNWQGKTIVASFDNGVTETATFSSSGDKLSVAVPSSASSANKMTLTAYPSDYPTELAKNVPSGKYRIISKNDKSRNYCYAWNTSGSNNAAWPGQKMTASGNYYYIDLNKNFAKCIFSVGNDTSKSADLTVKYNGNVAYYDGSNFVNVQSTSVNISNLQSNQNFFIMNSDNSVSVSKYNYNGSGIVATMKTVYLYAPGWSSAYITYDLSDAYQVTVAMTKQTSSADVTYFECQVPENSTFRFQPRQSSTAGASSNLTYPGDATNLYIMDAQKYWTSFDKLPTESNRIPNNFASNEAGKNIYGVTATYFDYMSDEEIKNGYLKNTNSGGNRKDTAFNSYLNSAISDYSKANSIKTPLYVGNFCDNQTPGSNIYNWNYTANNSNGLTDFWYAVQGLASNTLINNQLYVPTTSNGVAQSPLFDAAWLGGDNSKNTELAKIFDSYFPFVTETDESTGVTKYSFDSSGGGVRDSSGNLSGNKSKSDNVYFTWDGTTPKSVNYGYGSDYTVKDGSNSGTGEFQCSGTGFGVFPFNNTSKTNSVPKPGASTTTKTVPANEVICVEDWSNWGNVLCWAWSDSNSGKWVPLAKQEGTGNGAKYYFCKEQFPTGNNLKYKFTKDENWSAESNEYTGFGKLYWSNNWGSSGTNTTSVVLQSGDSYTRTGNDNTDYGFGIRMDMDFRVPENGLIGQSETYTVPSNEIWVKSNTQVYYYGYNSSSDNSGGLKALNVAKDTSDKEISGYYKISSNDIDKYKYYVLAYTNNWDDANNNSKRYPPDGQNKEISQYKGNVISFSSSGVSEIGTTVTLGADPVTFDYSGDDDLWVYISDDSGHSELVLDLGGDHKFTKGNINFNTMKATAETVYDDFNKSTTENPAVPGGQLWIKTKSHNNSETFNDMYLKTWNQLDQYGNTKDVYIHYDKIVTYKYKDGSTDSFFVFNASKLGDADVFTLNDQKSDEQSSSVGELCTVYMNKVSASGKALEIKNPRVSGSITQPVEHQNSAGSSSKPLGEVTKSFFGGQQLDPNKTYHMTVFYMERGLIESNLKVSFTMTPVTNDLLVDKTVVMPDDINNSTIAKAVYDNDTFGYTSSNNQETIAGKTYTYTQQSGDTESLKLGNNGSFNLKDDESAYFVSQFKTGSEMTVNESSVSSMQNGTSLSERYDTNWELFDDSGNSKGSGDSTQAIFNLEGEANKNVSLQLSYTNTLNTGGLNIAKTVKDKSGNNIDINQDFSYQVLLDVNGGEDYQAYPLNYSVTHDGSTTNYYTSDGTISFSPDSTVSIAGLPVGSTYKITESVPDGYTCTLNNQTGTIKSASSATVSFTNVQSDGEGTISVNKTLDGKKYSGNQFEFVLQGLESAGDGYIDATGITSTSNEVVNGTVTFNVSYSQVGKYRFSVKENPINPEYIGYKGDSNTYYVEINVVAGSEQSLEIASTTYYSDADFTTVIDDITFKNTTEKAKITINKENPAGNKIDAEFAVIRVSKAEGITGADVKKIMENTSLKSAVVVNSGATSGGKIEFNNLSVYQDGSKMYNPDSDAPTDSDNYLTGTYTPQTYCVVEYKATSGYNLNSTPYYVTFPLKADGKTLESGYYEDNDGYIRQYVDGTTKKDTDPYVYSQTFDYTNYPVVVPDASGEGMNSWITLGLMIVAFAGLLTAAYFITGHINRKRRMARVQSRK